MAPAAIKSEIPPSIGTQGGGQHPGEPAGGFGGGPPAKLVTVATNKHAAKNRCLVFINMNLAGKCKENKIDVQYVRKNRAKYLYLCD